MISTKVDSSALQLQIHTWYFKTKPSGFMFTANMFLTPRSFYAYSKGKASNVHTKNWSMFFNQKERFTCFYK